MKSTADSGPDEHAGPEATPSPAIAEPGEPAAPPTPWAKTAVRIVVAVVVAGAIFAFAIPRLTNADYKKAWDDLRHLSLWNLVVLNGANLWNVVSYWFMLMIALPGLTWGQAMVVNNGSTAVANVMPGGGALGMGVTWKMLRSWGFSGPAISRQILVVGVWNNFAKLALPVIAWAVLILGGGSSGPLISAAITGLVVLAVAVAVLWAILASDAFARRFGSSVERVINVGLRAIRRKPLTGLDDGMSEYRTELIETIRSRGPALTIAVVIDHLALYFVLLLSLRAVGVTDEAISWQEALAAFATMRLVTAVPITPGGLGFVEGGLVAVLAKMAPGDSIELNSKILAAVLIFRLISYVTPIILGALSLMYWTVSDRWKVPSTPAGVLDPAGST